MKNIEFTVTFPCIHRRKMTSLFIFIVMLLYMLSSCSYSTETRPSFKDDFSRIFAGEISKLNYWQDSVPYLLHVYNGLLYLYDGDTISTFVNNERSVFKDLSDYNKDDKHTYGLCFHNNLFYFLFVDMDSLTHYVYSLNLNTYEICGKGEYTISQCLPFGDSFYCPLSDTAYMVINSNGFNFARLENEHLENYSINNATIVKEYFTEDIRYGKLYLLDENGDKTRLSEISEYDRNYLYQLADGRIIVYSCEEVGRQSEVLIWIINTDGTVKQLFGNVSGELVYSTINICGDSLIVSLKRYEKWKIMGSIPFKNDELSGTWVINLNTYEARMITKTFYKGLYVFGDQIVCVDSKDCFTYLVL